MDHLVPWRLDLKVLIQDRWDADYHERTLGNLLDPLNFCPITAQSRECASIIDGQSMYFDDNHLSLAGARRFLAAQRASGALRRGLGPEGTGLIATGHLPPLYPPEALKRPVKWWNAPSRSIEACIGSGQISPKPERQRLCWGLHIGADRRLAGRSPRLPLNCNRRRRR